MSCHAVTPSPLSLSQLTTYYRSPGQGVYTVVCSRAGRAHVTGSCRGRACLSTCMCIHREGASWRWRQWTLSRSPRAAQAHAILNVVLGDETMYEYAQLRFAPGRGPHQGTLLGDRFVSQEKIPMGDVSLESGHALSFLPLRVHLQGIAGAAGE